MPFDSTTAKLYRGPGHRRRKRDVEAAKLAADVVREVIEGRAKAIVNKYVRRALGKNADRVLIHAIDKLLPESNGQAQIPAVIQFVQFNVSNHNSPQLSPEGIPVTILASDGNGKASGANLASSGRQGQNGIEFHDFEDVP